MEYYQVKLKSTLHEEFEDEHENVEKNVALVQVTARGKDITEECTVELTLSRRAMMALGVELIRHAHLFEQMGVYELHPSERDLISLNMGVFLHPESCKLVIGGREFEDIDDYLK